MTESPVENYNKKKANKTKQRERNIANVPDPVVTTEQNEICENKAEIKTDDSFSVRVDIDYLNIRKGPGKDYDRTGNYTGKGVFVITEVKDGVGSTAGWGRLKSGEGWISLEYATRV